MFDIVLDHCLPVLESHLVGASNSALQEHSRGELVLLQAFVVMPSVQLAQMWAL